MKKFQKILAGFLSLFLIFFSTPPVSLAAVEYTQDVLGQPVPVISIEDALTGDPAASVADSSTLSDLMYGGIVPRSEEDGIVELASHSYNDPLYSRSNNYWFEQANAKLAHHVTEGAGVTVAVIDTGSDFNHQDLGAAWVNQSELNGLPGVDDDGNGYIDDVRGYDFYNGDGDPTDDNGHGTFVRGIIGAVANNLSGIVGIATKATVMVLKALSATGSGYVTDVIDAIYYAANNGAHVINMSLGVATRYLSSGLKQAFVDAMNYARSKNVVTVAAAGNENSDVANSYPAALADFAVGAVNKNKKRVWWSNYGPGLDLMAGADYVLSLLANGTNFGSSCVSDPRYSCASGTSFSSPIVAGAVALLRAHEPLLTVAQIYQRFISTARDLGAKGFDKLYGWGLVDIYRALTTGSATSSGSGSSESSGSGRKGKGGLHSSAWESFAPDFEGLPAPVNVTPPNHFRIFSSGLKGSRITAWSQVHSAKKRRQP